jgi:hypothetical protein
VYQGTPEELQAGKLLLEKTVSKYLTKDKEGPKRYLIEIDKNQLYFCLIDTPLGKKVKKIKDLEKDVVKLKKDKP